MKKENKVWAMTVWIAFWWLAPNQTNAQQDSTTITSLDELVITATKFPKSKSETGKVLTIIDEDQVKASAGKDLSQLLNEQAGLFINGANSNPGKDKSVYLRGAKGDYTLILLDGVPLNDPSSIGGGAYDLRLIPLDQVERIEILKGNQSTLYGSNAIAGVINIITKKESNKAIAGSALLSYGSFNTFRGSINVSGSTKKMSYNVGGSRLSSNGISEAKDSTDNANYDKDRYSQNAVYASVGVQATKNFNIQPFVRFSDFDGGYDGGAFADSKNLYNSSLLNTGLNSQYKLQRGAVNFSYGYDKSNRTYVDKDYNYTSHYKGRFHHGEIFLNYDVNEKLQVLSGIGTQFWQMLDATAYKNDTSALLVSPYVSLFLRNLNGFSAEVGGRYNHHSRYGSNVTHSVNPSYLINKSVKIFLNASSGFKAPSLQQLYGQYGRNPNLKPEKSQSAEMGVQLFVNKKIDVRVVGFARRIKDVIFYATKYINQDEQRDRGVEVEAGWAINSNWKAKAFYSYVEGALYVNEKSGPNNLLRIPKHSLGLNVQGQLMPRWIVSVNLRHTGKRSDKFFDMQTFQTKDATLGSYQLLDLYSEYSLRRFKIFIDAKNVLNQTYYEIYGYSVLPINIMSGVSIKI